MPVRALVRRLVKRWLTVNPSRAAYKVVLRDLEPLLELPYAAEVLATQRFARLVRPLVLATPPARRAVVIAPHPDDDAFGAGGALLKLADAGAALRVVYLTDGDDPERTEGLRQDAMASCAAVGAEPVFLHLPLDNLPVDDATAALLHRAVADFAPEIVFTAFLLDDHDDHRRANHLFMRAFAGGGLAAEIWAYQVYSTVVPNVVLDITDVAERKRALIRLWPHASGNRDWAHYVMGMNAMACRYVPGRREIYGEPYFVVPASEYFDLCRRYFAAPAAALYRGAAYRGG